jgi:hypothetical protein
MNIHIHEAKTTVVLKKTSLFRIFTAAHMHQTDDQTYKYLLYSTADSHFSRFLYVSHGFMLTIMSVKILQKQGNDKASSCHKVSVNQELMFITIVNINAIVSVTTMEVCRLWELKNKLLRDSCVSGVK